jgi:hypothetical protein
MPHWSETSGPATDPGTSQTNHSAETNQATSEQDPQGASGSATGDDPLETGAHVAAIPLEGETAGSAGGGPAVDDGIGGELLTPGEFYQLFCAAHRYPGQMLGLPSLRDAETHPGAREASDAIYETACEVPSLRFLVERRGKWFQRVSVIAAFAVPVYGGAFVELRGKRAKGQG